MATRQKLKAPFPYFGGKSTVAQLVWDRLGPVDNYIEPFFGSGAVLLLRPDAPKIETANDADTYLANFWRATQHAPEAVAAFADGPVNEADLHSRHRWLVLSDDAQAFRQRMRTDPDYFDAKVAGWWCWGLCCWIGSGWCSEPELRADGTPREKLPLLQNGSHPGKEQGKGVHGMVKGQDNRKPRIDGGEGQYGHGVHAKGELPMERVKGLREKLPKLAGGGKKTDTTSYAGSHIHQDDVPALQDGKRPMIGNGHNGAMLGIHAVSGNRPQLADAYDIGRGVHSNGDLGTCGQRRAWLLDWFGRLRDRLRTVRVCCGHWLRVCESDSVTTRLGVTGVFLDPPYSKEAGRDMNLYAQDCGAVAHEVRAWCLERGSNPLMRIVLAGYEGEHNELEAHGWDKIAWKTSGGYGNRSAKGKENAAKERLWVSPHCQRESGLFEGLE